MKLSNPRLVILYQMGLLYKSYASFDSQFPTIHPDKLNLLRSPLETQVASECLEMDVLLNPSEFKRLHVLFMLMLYYKQINMKALKAHHVSLLGLYKIKNGQKSPSREGHVQFHKDN